MIEPQNTMLPLAESRPSDQPQGEGEGFGDMLAQSLGMIPQVDPSAVQQLNTGAQQQQDTANGTGEQPTAEEQVDAGLPAATILGSQPLGGQAVPNAAPNVDPPDLSGRQPGADGEDTTPSLVPSTPVRAVRYEKTEQGARPLPTLPGPPTPEPAPHVIRPIDTVWKPSPLSQPTTPDQIPIQDETDLTLQPSRPVDSIWHPVVSSDPESQNVAGGAPVAVSGPSEDPAAPTRAPGINPPDPTVAPGRGTGPDLPALGLEPAPVGRNPLRGTRGPTLPRPPALDATPDGSRPEAAAASPQPTPHQQPRVELVPDQPIRLDTTPAAKVTGSAGTESGVTVASETTVSDAPATIAAPSVDSGSSPSSAGSVPAAALRPQASALAERVMQAIDLQRTQPPPRSMVVDIPELEGLRLLVSVRSAGNVTVTPASGSGNPDAFAPFATDLSRVLAERGFVMNGDGRQRGYNPYADDDPAPDAPRRATFRRPTRLDNDLRI